MTIHKWNNPFNKRVQKAGFSGYPLMLILNLIPPLNIIFSVLTLIFLYKNKQRKKLGELKT